jgi:hypothetical protein
MIVLRPGDILIGRYRIETAPKEGGTGLVYFATDIITNTRCAVKQLNLDLSSDTTIKNLFFKEAQKLCELKHPNLPKFENYVDDKDSVFLVMERIDGHEIGYIDDSSPIQQPLSEIQFIPVIWQIMAALEYCHSQKVVHRDVKPENILVKQNGQAVLIDFGISGTIWDEIGIRAGSIYSPPEQRSGAKPDIRNDIYSLSATIYRLACGSPPPTSKQPSNEHQTQILPPADFPYISNHTYNWILNGMKYDIDKRYPLISRMRDAYRCDAIRCIAYEQIMGNTHKQARLFAFMRLEGAIILAITLLCTALSVMQFAWMIGRWWQWLFLGATFYIAHGLSSLKDNAIHKQLFEQTFHTYCDLTRLKTPEVRQCISLALNCRQQVSKRLDTNINSALTIWCLEAFDLALVIDAGILRQQTTAPALACLEISTRELSALCQSHISVAQDTQEMLYAIIQNQVLLLHDMCNKLIKKPKSS